MYQQFLDVGLQAVEVAKTITLGYFGKSLDDLGYHTKADDVRHADHQKSPVTLADQEAEHAIKTLINQHFPDHGCIGEEEGSDNEQAEYKRIIDPIDGTRNFARGLPYRAIMLALSRNDEIIVAIVCTPVLGDLVRATKGGGAFCNGKQAHVSARPLSEAYLGHARHTYFQKYGLQTQFDALCKQVWYMRSIISREMIYVVTGCLDVTVSLASSGYYDNAPFKLLVEEAGGTVTTLSGGAFSRDDTSMIASNGVVHKEVVRCFGGEHK